MRSIKILQAVSATIILFSCLVGCTLDRSLRIDTGFYNMGGVRGKDQVEARRTIKQLAIDRDGNLAVFTLADGSEIVTEFKQRDREAWPEGCPTNIYAHRMEVMEIEQETLVIGGISIVNPILVRNCPPEPNQVVLREDGDIGNARGRSGTACSWSAMCIFFNQQQELP
jgi:hypothetical protein